MYSHLYQFNIFIVYHTIFLLYIYILKLIYFLYIQLDKFQLILITFSMHYDTIRSTELVCRYLYTGIYGGLI